MSASASTGTGASTRAQVWLDRAAISGSALCLLHCLATPLLLALAPVLSAGVPAGERVHHALLGVLLPISVAALFLGARHHRDRAVLALGSTGLLALVAVAALGEARLGGPGETAATVACGTVLALGHWRNQRLCRRAGCAA